MSWQYRLSKTLFLVIYLDNGQKIFAMYQASKFMLYHIEFILTFNYSVLEFIKIYVLELAIKKVKLFNTK